MIDLNRSLVIVSTYPDGCIDHRTTAFFIDRGLPFRNLVSANVGNTVIEGRNKVMRDVVISNLPHYDWFIFMDKDNFPLGNLTELFLDDIKADAVGCEYDTGGHSSWIYADSFHMGLVRIRASVIGSLKPPYFMFKYSEDGTIMTDCECNFLRSKLIEQGAVITRRGKVGHNTGKNKISWHSSS